MWGGLDETTTGLERALSRPVSQSSIPKRSVDSGADGHFRSEKSRALQEALQRSVKPGTASALGRSHPPRTRRCTGCAVLLMIVAGLIASAATLPSGF
jgi:hypothetical protein